MGKKKLRIYAGTSGWTYDDWQGVFYPEDVRGADRLAFYAEKFNTVEVNATFYRFPTANMIDAWNRRLPRGFHLVVKGSRRVTHFKKLQDCREITCAFMERVLELSNLRIVLWQLPPSLHKDTDRLEQFLSELPDQVRFAIEFRHASWWDEEVVAVLEEHRAAFVAVSHPQLPDTILPTTDFLYLRFHGLGPELYRYDYSTRELQEWATRLRPHLPSRSLYAFFNNDYDSHAPCNAAAFAEFLQE